MSLFTTLKQEHREKILNLKSVYPALVEKRIKELEAEEYVVNLKLGTAMDIYAMLSNESFNLIKFFDFFNR
jgi:hypothetical protein